MVDRRWVLGPADRGGTRVTGVGSAEWWGEGDGEEWALSLWRLVVGKRKGNKRILDFGGQRMRERRPVGVAKASGFEMGL